MTFPSSDQLRETSQGCAPENAGIRHIGRPPPSIVFGKVPRWHLVTASLLSGLAQIAARPER